MKEVTTATGDTGFPRAGGSSAAECRILKIEGTALIH
jgi:hypothetical protein